MTTQARHGRQRSRGNFSVGIASDHRRAHKVQCFRLSLRSWASDFHGIGRIRPYFQTKYSTSNDTVLIKPSTLCDVTNQLKLLIPYQRFPPHTNYCRVTSGWLQLIFSYIYISWHSFPCVVWRDARANRFLSADYFANNEAYPCRTCSYWRC